MNIRQIANSAIVSVNPNITVSVLKSTGYTIDSNRRQVPSYAAAVVGPAQLQALDGSDLKQLEGLNIQGVLRAIYLRGSVAGVIRPDGVGGDLVLIGDQTWLVVKVLESWPTWTKAAIVLQESE
jgi:hypothetical protein